ncbi:MAG: tetratricopeptide repeat protein [Bacteroidales bacterium]
MQLLLVGSPQDSHFSFEVLTEENGHAAYNLAFGLEDKQDYNQAIEWYWKAIGIDSTQVYAYSALGRLYNKMNRSVEALLILNQAKKKFPDSDYAYLIYKNLGNAYLFQGMNDLALKYLELSREIIK